MLIDLLCATEMVQKEIIAVQHLKNQVPSFSAEGKSNELFPIWAGDFGFWLFEIRLRPDGGNKYNNAPERKKTLIYYSWQHMCLLAIWPIFNNSHITPPQPEFGVVFFFPLFEPKNAVHKSAQYISHKIHTDAIYFSSHIWVVVAGCSFSAASNAQHHTLP